MDADMPDNYKPIFLNEDHFVINGWYFTPTEDKLNYHVTKYGYRPKCLVRCNKNRIEKAIQYAKYLDAWKEEHYNDF